MLVHVRAWGRTPAAPTVDLGLSNPVSFRLCHHLSHQMYPTEPARSVNMVYIVSNLAIRLASEQAVGYT
jgi:hypothetical protein